MPLSRTLSLVLTLAASSAHADLYGVDVSRWQYSVDWTAMKDDGIAYGFVKATEGVDFIDERFVENMNGARAAGVPVGPYHFARPDSYEGTLADPVKQDAVNEANDFVDAIEPYYTAYPDAYLRPVLDVETLPETSEINTVAEQKQYLSDWIHDFADVVIDRLGVEPIIYLNSNYANTYIDDDVAQYDLWLARWTYTVNSPPTASNLGPWDDWEFWQWTDSWSIGGESSVDGNYFLGDEADLQEFYFNNTAEPQLDGDYNGDGVVDAADYTVWRDSWLTVDEDHPADGDGDGFVGNSDYLVWVEDYGLSTTEAVAVPEPGALAPAVLTILAALAARRL